MRSLQWTWFVDQQLGCIKKSNLCSFAKINMIVCMPLNWMTAPDNSGFYKNNVKYGDPGITFIQNLSEYIDARYPFAKIVKLRDNDETNLYEGLPLGYMYEECLKQDMYVFYFHSKGITKSHVQIANWRETLHHFLIQKWHDNISALQTGYDVSAVSDSTTDNDIVSGNFFWADSDYIKKLPHPLSVRNYSREELIHNQHLNKYIYELWIRSKNPKINWTHKTNVDHYSTCYFIENA